MVDEDDMNRLYWPESGGPRENPNRVFSDQALSRAQEGIERSMQRYREAIRASRGPMQFRWSDPGHDIVRDLEDCEPGSLPLTRREVEESVTAMDGRSGISVDGGFTRRVEPDPDAVARYHMVPDCGTDHGGTTVGCPWCSLSLQTQRLAERREENRELTEAANRLLQVWSDFDTSSAPIPRHFRIRMENAAQRLRAARP